MPTSTLLADPTSIRLEKIIQHDSSLTLVVRATRAQAECPRCHRPSKRVHSYYTRRVADLPWHGVAVRLELRTRRFRCQNSLCTKRVFCERLPSVVACYGRQTVRLDEALRLIELLLGGEGGARAALRLAMATSPDTLPRRVRAAVKPCAPTPRILGVDDFAFRRGRRYGTILVDLEQRRVIDLLADRDAATLAAWLKAHPGVEVVSRDRSPTYAAGVNDGAPAALQVADRFHLLMNVRETLEKVISRASPRLRLPSAHEAAWMLLRPDELADEEKSMVESLCRLSPEVAQSQQLAPGFVEVVKERRADELRGWIIDAQRSEVAEFITFANGLTADLRAVRAALGYEWSNGQVEGQVHRLKLIKRQMYGRGKLDLLRARVLYAA
jgi:transposase